MAKVTCSGLGSGTPPYHKEVPTVDMYPNMSTQGVQVLIELSAYERLVNWASMGRTLNYVLSTLEEAATSYPTADLRADHANLAYDELKEVKDALDKCHQAVRRHWANLPHPTNQVK